MCLRLSADLISNISQMNHRDKELSRTSFNAQVQVRVRKHKKCIRNGYVYENDDPCIREYPASMLDELWRSYFFRSWRDAKATTYNSWLKAYNLNDV